VFALIIYGLFRCSVYSYLRVKRKSRTFIRKSKNGYLNYWIYKEINDNVGLGYVFYLNILLLALTLLYFLLAVALGWIGFLSLPIAICNVMLCIVQVPSIIFSDIYSNLELYKKKFVLFAIPPTGGRRRSSLSVIFMAGSLLFFAVYNIYLAI
jgi:hypothetical protein